MITVALLLVHTASAATYTLPGVRQAATARAIEVEQAAAAADAADAQAVSVRAGALPSIVGSASGSVGAGFTAFGFPRPVQRQLGVGVDASWLLVAPETWAAGSSARLTAEGRHAMQAWTQVTARARATELYTAALAAQKELAARQTALVDATEAEKAVQALVTTGIRPPSHAAQARASLATVHAELANAEWIAHARCAELQALLREPADAAPQCVLAEVDWAPPKEGPASHPALDAAAMALAGSEANKKSAVMALVPTLGLSAGAAWYRADQGGGPGWSAGADLAVPLFASGSAKAQITVAEAQVHSTRLALEAQELQLRVALRTATIRLKAAEQGVAARQVALGAAQEALDMVKARYSAGMDSLTDWLTSRQARDAAAVALARAEAERGAAHAALESARGVGGT